MSYQVEVKTEALTNLEKISPVIQSKILKKLSWLADNFEQIIPLPLTANLKGFFKLRVGDYRIIYTFDKDSKLITVHQIGHRREIYD